MFENSFANSSDDDDVVFVETRIPSCSAARRANKSATTADSNSESERIARLKRKRLSTNLDNRLVELQSRLDELKDQRKYLGAATSTKMTPHTNHASQRLRYQSPDARRSG